MLGARPSMTAERANHDAILLPDGRRWRGAPDEGVRLPQKARRSGYTSTRTVLPSPLPLSHSGEGFPALHFIARIEAFEIA